MDARAKIAIARDAALMLIGLVGIVHQEFIGPVKIELLSVYTVLLGVPGAANAIALIRGAPTPAVSGSPTESESSPSASPVQQSPS